ncbi:hypothetical protein AMK06_CH03371 [Rhizobium sp. N541]|uniref:SAM-dependent methyltransferase n=1 Tax=unclassified Rhizobium TaxID=2613769 RepID=UPI0007EE56FB|nr:MULTISPECIES: SAM-dependent methyltransferase [unclassified Rhizobium]ANM18245.1 hypothetical protein AMK06_CH03371 [Rhizobium sp. N541]ANM24631.1 hypothetical protein AMK07_CH03369 [Rhizobium sp. N941]
MTFVAYRDPTQLSIRTPADVDTQLLKLLADKGSDSDFWSSKDRDRTDSAHNIFQYPAMMVPLVQRRLLGAVLEARPEIQSVYDPFMGSGTSLVSGMHYGLNVYGNDINPLAVLISRVRTARSVDFTVGAIAEQVVSEASADRRGTIETSMANREKWFQADVSLELSRLRRAIRKCDDLWVRWFLWVTLAETVRLTSNDRTSTYKLHARPASEIEKRTLSPIAVFRDLARENATSFWAFRHRLNENKQLKSAKYIAETDVRIGDTRNAQDYWGDAAPFDLLMTSPPYGDNLTTVTYGQHSYLPLHWIDFKDIDPLADIATLRTTHEIDRRSLGGTTSENVWTEAKLLAASSRLKRFADGLPAKPADGRARLIRFYRDFGASLDSILNVMKPDSYMIWTVGNRNIAGQQVPTDLVLSELVEGLKCKVVTTLTRRIHHKRMPDRNASSATMREEKILLVRKIGA